MNPAKMAKEDHDVGVFRIYARNHLDEAPTNVDSMSSGAASDVGGVVDLIADRQSGIILAHGEAACESEQVAVAPLLNLTTDSKSADFES
jgi:hypothetical protein